MRPFSPYNRRFMSAAALSLRGRPSAESIIQAHIDYEMTNLGLMDILSKGKRYTFDMKDPNSELEEVVDEPTVCNGPEKDGEVSAECIQEQREVRFARRMAEIKSQEEHDLP